LMLPVGFSVSFSKPYHLHLFLSSL
jgi:hypothetical protein